MLGSQRQDGALIGTPVAGKVGTTRQRAARSLPARQQVMRRDRLQRRSHFWLSLPLFRDGSGPLSVQVIKSTGFAVKLSKFRPRFLTRKERRGSGRIEQ
jgi:hypothetical protein